MNNSVSKAGFDQMSERQRRISENNDSAHLTGQVLLPAPRIPLIALFLSLARAETGGFNTAEAAVSTF